jgi:tRNA(fMet)-specific endonuclease VapC
MSYLLHTDTCSSIIRKVRVVSDRFTQCTVDVFLSVVSITGLGIWLLQSRTPLRYRQTFFSLQQTITLIDVIEPIAHRAALIDKGLRSQGQRLGLADLLIAATTLERGLTLVTRKVPQFANIPGLTVIDWSIP